MNKPSDLERDRVLEVARALGTFTLEQLVAFTGVKKEHLHLYLETFPNEFVRLEGSTDRYRVRTGQSGEAKSAGASPANLELQHAYRRDNPERLLSLAEQVLATVPQTSVDEWRYIHAIGLNYLSQYLEAQGLNHLAYATSSDASLRVSKSTTTNDDERSPRVKNLLGMLEGIQSIFLGRGLEWDWIGAVCSDLVDVPRHYSTAYISRTFNSLVNVALEGCQWQSGGAALVCSTALLRLRNDARTNLIGAVKRAPSLIQSVRPTHRSNDFTPSLYKVVPGSHHQGRYRVLVYKPLLTLLPRNIHTMRVGEEMAGTVVVAIVDDEAGVRLHDYATRLQEALSENSGYSPSALIGEAVQQIQDIASEMVDEDESIVERSDDDRRDLLRMVGVLE